MTKHQLQISASLIVTKYYMHTLYDMRKTLVTGIALISLSGCTNEQVARSALYEARFHDIEFTGYSLFGCSPSDFIHTGFKAKNALGSSIQGVVCSNPFSDKTQVKHTELD